MQDVTETANKCLKNLILKGHCFSAYHSYCKAVAHVFFGVFSLYKTYYCKLYLLYLGLYCKELLSFPFELL